VKKSDFFYRRSAYCFLYLCALLSVLRIPLGIIPIYFSFCLDERCILPFRNLVETNSSVHPVKNGLYNCPSRYCQPSRGALLSGRRKRKVIMLKWTGRLPGIFARRDPGNKMHGRRSVSSGRQRCSITTVPRHCHNYSYPVF